MQADMATGASLGPIGDLGLTDIGIPDIRPGDVNSDVLLNTPDMTPESDVPGTSAIEAKVDDEFLVPPAISKKSHLSLAGTLAAWREQGPLDSSPSIVVWDYGAKAEPQALQIPYLKDPVDLRIDGDWLVYVDTIWGDSDVFGFRLSDGEWRLVAGGPGAQRLGDLSGGRVLYTDCTECLLGTAPSDAAEVYEVNLSEGGLPQRLTNNKVNDTAPTYGTLADGSTSSAWVSSYNTLAAQAAGALETFPQDVAWIQDVALVGGALVWRPSPAIINPDSMIPSPMIINPDSMIPSDLFQTDLVSGETSSVSSHIEIDNETPLALSASGTHLAFASGVLGMTGSASRW